MNRATHDDQGGIKGIIKWVGVVWIQEVARASYDLIIDTLLLTAVIDAHVSEDTKW